MSKDLIIDFIITLISGFWFVWFLGSFISVVMAVCFYFNLSNFLADIHIMKLEKRLKKMEEDGHQRKTNNQ